MRSENGGWSFDYSVSCYLGAINVPPFVQSKKISKEEDLSFCLYLIHYLRIFGLSNTILFNGIIFIYIIGYKICVYILNRIKIRG